MRRRHFLAGLFSLIVGKLHSAKNIAHKGKVHSAKGKHKKFVSRPLGHFSKGSTWNLRQRLEMRAYFNREIMRVWYKLVEFFTANIG